MNDWNKPRVLYAKFPWNEEAEKRKRWIRRHSIVDTLLLSIFCILFGAFGMLMAISYYPLPWW